MNFFGKYPLLRILITVVLGTMVANCWVFDRNALMSFSLSALVLFILLLVFRNTLKYTYQWITGSSFHLLFFLLILSYVSTYRLSAHISELDYEGKKEALGVLNGPFVRKSTMLHTPLQLLVLKSGSHWKVNQSKIMATIRLNPHDSITPGDLIMFHSNIRRITSSGNPGSFDYREFLARKGMRKQVFIDSNQYRMLQPGFAKSVFHRAMRFREKVAMKMEKKGLTTDSSSFLMALLLGDKGRLIKEKKEQYARVGMMHVMAVSGMHVGTLYLFIEFVMRLFNRLPFKKEVKLVLTTLTLWAYCLLTGSSPSVLRACLVLNLMIVGKAFKQKNNGMNQLAASAIILLLTDPAYLKEVGFQLSYLAVGGIVILYPWLYKWFVAPNWFLDKLWSLSCVSIAAQLMTTPLTLYYFHQFPTYFILTNLLVVPLAMAIFYFGLLLFLVLEINFLATFLSKGMNNLIALLNRLVDWIDNLPFATIDGIYLSFIGVLLLYAAFSALLVFLFTHQRFYVLLVAICCVLFYMKHLNWLATINTQKKLVVYSLKKGFAIDFIHGREHVLFADTGTLKNERGMNYHFGGHWIRAGLKQVKKRNACIDKKSNKIEGYYLWKRQAVNHHYYQFFKYKLLLLRSTFSGEWKGTTSLSIDGLVLSNNVPYTIRDLARRFQFNCLVFDRTNYTTQVKKWIKECEVAGIDYHDMRKDGAFIRSL